MSDIKELYIDVVQVQAQNRSESERTARKLGAKTALPREIDTSVLHCNDDAGECITM